MGLGPFLEHQIELIIRYWKLFFYVFDHRPLILIKASNVLEILMHTSHSLQLNNLSRLIPRPKDETNCFKLGNAQKRFCEYSHFKPRLSPRLANLTRIRKRAVSGLVIQITILWTFLSIYFINPLVSKNCQYCFLNFLRFQISLALSAPNF
jgi:hypothetical protein